MTLPDELLQTFALQHGVASSDQALLSGLTKDRRRRALANGSLQLCTPRVLRLAGTASSVSQCLMTGVLDAGPGAVLSHHSALAVWGAPGFAAHPIHIIHPRGGIRRDNSIAVVHSSRVLPPEHITVLDGIPITRPARALFDVAAWVHPLKLARAMDRLGTMRLLAATELYEVLDALKNPGRDLGAIESLIHARGPDWIPPVSNLQRRAHRLLAEDGQEPMEEEIDLGDEVGWIGRVDGWDRLARVVMEIDSDLHHTALSDRDADARRDAAFVAAGIQVVRFTEQQVWYEPDVVRATTRAARQRGRIRHGERLMAGRAA